jgi:nucleoside phosphorylase
MEAGGRYNSVTFQGLTPVRIAVFSAFPQESRHVLKNLARVRNLGRHPFRIASAEYSSGEIIVVQSGMGVRNSEAAFRYVFQEFSPEIILSIGFGGALYDGALTGDLVWASRVFYIPERPGNRPLSLPVEQGGEDRIQWCKPQSVDILGAREIAGKLSGKVVMHEGCIFTIANWMRKSEIRRIVPEEASCPVCDMETFSLARLSLQEGLSFFAVRSITDRASEEIVPDLLCVSDATGRFRYSRALALIAQKPGLASEMIKLGKRARTASENLWHAVRHLIESMS